MWVSRGVWEEYITKAAAGRAERADLQLLVSRLDTDIAALKLAVDRERKRAEAAVDEMLKVATMFQAQPVAQEARERMDPRRMDNIFEEEDAEEVARDRAFLDKAGVGALFEESLG